MEVPKGEEVQCEDRIVLFANKLPRKIHQYISQANNINLFMNLLKN
jgi:hypothetical protein